MTIRTNQMFACDGTLAEMPPQVKFFLERGPRLPIVLEANAKTRCSRQLECQLFTC
jgi:hypothetical protein